MANLRLKIAEILNINLINKKYISLDLWSIVHFLTGGFLMIIFGGRISFVFLALVLWELFEFLMYGIFKTGFFLAESFTNVIWDILIGLLGAVIIGLKSGKNEGCKFKF